MKNSSDDTPTEPVVVMGPDGFGEAYMPDGRIVIVRPPSKLPAKATLIAAVKKLKSPLHSKRIP